VGELEIDRELRQVSLAGAPVSLTRSEFEILAVLAASPGRVFTRAQLIDQALSPDFDGFDRTIDTHIWSLRRKLGEPRGNPRYIASELGVGYRMRSGDAS
jgi:DNA-binding response OmpR family regulator